MSDGLLPADLLAQARRLVDHPDSSTAGMWPRAASILARQALEAALDELWLAKEPAIAQCSRRAQLLCLAEVVDADLARQCASTWGSLSRACHHHAYELPPTAAELHAWIGEVGAIVGAIAGAIVRSRDRSGHGSF